MAPVLEYYNATHQFNNLLTVLLKYLSQKSKHLLVFPEYLFTKFQHNTGIIIPCIMLKIIPA